MDDVILWISSFTAFATLGVPFVIELIFSKIWQPEGKVQTSITTFIIAIACAFATWGAGAIFEVGFLVDREILDVLVVGFGAGLVSNWTWVNVEWVKAIVQIILGEKEPEEEDPEQPEE